jgi:NADH-quinone oxidoreductase subunit G
VRFCKDIAGTGELTLARRGHKAIIDVFPEVPLDNAWSACAADLCPVGALTVKDSRFKERVWNMESVPSLCPHCGNGCSIKLEHRSGVVKRFLPRPEPEVNDHWLCDHGRFAFEWMNRPVLFEPYVDGTEAVWEEALGALAQMVRNAKRKAAALASPFLTLEELHLLKQIFPSVYLLPATIRETRIRSRTEWLTSMNLAPNETGAKKLGYAPYRGEALEAALVFHHPLVDLPKINANAFFIDTRYETEVNSEAAGILPGALFPEKAGTYLNDHGRIQFAPQAFPPQGLARPALDYLLDLAKLLGKDLPYSTLEGVFRAVPLSRGRGYADLPFRVEP